MPAQHPGTVVFRIVREPRIDKHHETVRRPLGCELQTRGLIGDLARVMVTFSQFVPDSQLISSLPVAVCHLVHADFKPSVGRHGIALFRGTACPRRQRKKWPRKQKKCASPAPDRDSGPARKAVRTSAGPVSGKQKIFEEVRVNHQAAVSIRCLPHSIAFLKNPLDHSNPNQVPGGRKLRDEAQSSRSPALSPSRTLRPGAGRGGAPQKNRARKCETFLAVGQMPRIRFLPCFNTPARVAELVYAHV